MWRETHSEGLGENGKVSITKEDNTSGEDDFRGLKSMSENGRRILFGP